MMEPATRDLCLVLEVATLAKITVTQATRAIAEIAAVTRAEATAVVATKSNRHMSNFGQFVIVGVDVNRSKPNKAPEPTITAVTIHADAWLAPAVIVAQL